MASRPSSSRSSARRSVIGWRSATAATWYLNMCARQEVVELMLDRVRRPTRRHRTESDRDLPSARHRPLYVSRRHPTACRSTSGFASRRAHPTPLETALRRGPLRFV
jgi:hypothetical protein